MKFKRIAKRKRITRKESGNLKILDFFMLGFGSMIGVGWAVSSNRWLSQAGGPNAAFLGFIIGTLLLIPIGLSYGEMISVLPVSGGVMAHAYAAFGSFASFLSSWFVLLAYISILPWEAIYINEILVGIFPFLDTGPTLYYFMGNAIKLYPVLLGIVFAFILLVINIKGSKSAARLQGFLSWTIIVIGVIVIIFSFFKADIKNLEPVYMNLGLGNHKDLLTGIISMIVLVPFFMSGFDSISQSIGEAQKEIHAYYIARTIVLSILAAGAFYALIILSTASVEPWTIYALRDAPAMGNMLEAAYPSVIGVILKNLILIGTIAGLLTTWNGMFLSSAKLIQSMGDAGLLPRILAYKHKKYKTPVYASIFCFFAAAAGPFLGIKFVDPLTNLGSVSFSLGWFFTSISAIAMRIKARSLWRGFSIFGGKYSLGLAAVISTGILLATFLPFSPAFMGYNGIMLFFAWLIIGIIFYYFTNYGERGISEEERSMKILGQKSNEFTFDYEYVMVDDKKKRK